MDGTGDDDLSVPGWGPEAFEGGPNTIGELARKFAAAVSRESAPWGIVRAIQYEFDPDAYIHDELQITDHPETTGFHVRLQAHPLDAAGTEQRALVNFEGERSIIRLEAITRDAGSVFLPGYVDEQPVMRRRVQPIKLDLARVGGAVGTVSRLIVQVYEMRRVSFEPRSGEKGEQAPPAELEVRRIGKPVPTQREAVVMADVAKPVGG